MKSSISAAILASLVGAAQPAFADTTSEGAAKLHPPVTAQAQAGATTAATNASVAITSVRRVRRGARIPGTFDTTADASVERFAREELHVLLPAHSGDGGG